MRNREHARLRQAFIAIWTVVLVASCSSVADRVADDACEYVQTYEESPELLKEAVRTSLRGALLRNGVAPEDADRVLELARILIRLVDGACDLRET